ncbi:MAG: hypothetical protein EAZ61_11510 [Oscillatoriales cyanobacterium]|jgi:hypothetical protein|nr:MAG: hypothetical protein EAZ61_11510 [Oscillatoriales cyanobacterium]
MDTTTIRKRINTIEEKRSVLLDLLENADIGTLRIDVNQALEEIDDLLEEFDRTFPDSTTNTGSTGIAID